MRPKKALTDEHRHCHKSVHSTASSCVQTWIPQHQTTDMAHMTHTLLPSFAAQRPGAFLPCASRYDYVLACGHMHPSIRTAPAVLSRTTAVCTELQWLTRILGTPMLGALLSHGVLGRIADRQSCVACRDKRNDRSQSVMEEQKQHRTIF